jgi:hypothetical protein
MTVDEEAFRPPQRLDCDKTKANAGIFGLNIKSFCPPL